MAFRTVRVFISSTFKDMNAERDFLVRRVFPALRQRMGRQLNLVDVDLRWGVSESSDALAVCREVIDEVAFFLCILGGRYGSVPPDGHQSITQSEIRYAVFIVLGQQGGLVVLLPRPRRYQDDEESWPGEFREPSDSANA